MQFKKGEILRLYNVSVCINVHLNITNTYSVVPIVMYVSFISVHIADCVNIMILPAYTMYMQYLYHFSVHVRCLHVSEHMDSICYMYNAKNKRKSHMQHINTNFLHRKCL